jgi:carboxylesterase
MQKTIQKVGKIMKKARGAVFADPHKLYREELALTDKPFYFEGNNEKAVLLIHGWTAVPYELRRLGKYLNENGYTASGLMLPGHGTVPKDLEEIKWEDWLWAVREEYLRLKENHQKVYVVGTSMGSNLALLLAGEFSEIPALVLMATPWKIKFEKAVEFLTRLNMRWAKYKKKFYPPTFGSRKTITRLIAYQTYPIVNVLEVLKLVRESREILPRVKQPVFLLQSMSDHVVAKKSLERIFSQIGSSVKKKKYIKRAYHTFISDIKNEGVFEEILDFLNEN